MTTPPPALRSAPSVERPALFLAWAVEMFGEIAVEKRERVTRFVEEAIELAQATGLDGITIQRVIDRVYSRSPGDVAKEIGQAQACLETLAEVFGLSADTEAAREFDRVRTIPKEEWDRRHGAKVALGIANTSPAPTPDHSAAPEAARAAGFREGIEAAVQRLDKAINAEGSHNARRALTECKIAISALKPTASPWRERAKGHVIDLEQCSLFVDSVPLARSMTNAATFLREAFDIPPAPQNGGER